MIRRASVEPFLLSKRKRRPSCASERAEEEAEEVSRSLNGIGLETYFAVWASDLPRPGHKASPMGITEHVIVERSSREIEQLEGINQFYPHHHKCTIRPLLGHHTNQQD